MSPMTCRPDVQVTVSSLLMQDSLFGLEIAGAALVVSAHTANDPE